MKLTKAIVAEDLTNTARAQTASRATPRPAARLDSWCLSLLARQFNGAQCHIRLWDGSVPLLLTGRRSVR